MSTQKIECPFAERLIDLQWYAKQAGVKFLDQQDAYQHFMHYGQKDCLNPSPFFFTQWYVWQNPDFVMFPTVLDHFIYKSTTVPIDPAPFFDAVTLLQENKAYRNMAEILIALTEGKDCSVSPNFVDHLSELSVRQAAVHNSIRSHYIRRRITNRRRLVWVQAGSRFSTTQWFKPDSPRSWDFMCNWYTQDGLDLRHGDIHLIQPGTKSTAVYHVLKNDPELFNSYDLLLFLDDDLEITHEDIDRLFDIATQDNLTLFQPALMPGSYGVWKDLFQQSTRGARKTTGVEIMMPGFTSEALFSCREAFGRSISGYGLDFMFSEQIQRNGGTCGVVDAVQVRHKEKIDEQEGPYYRLMRQLGIRYKLELYSAINELGKYPCFANLKSV